MTSRNPASVITGPVISAPVAWAVLGLAVTEALAVLLPLLAFDGQPNDDGVDLLISPAGYAFAIWAVIYVLAIAVGVVFVRKRTSGTGSAQRLAIDLAITCGAATLWLIVSAASLDWLPSILLTVMAAALFDAARIAAGPADPNAPSWITTLVRITVGIYAGWASAAVFINWAADLARSGIVDATSLGWQLAILIAAALYGVGVTFRVGAALPAYPLTLVWALLAIIVGAWTSSSAVVIVAVFGLVAVGLAYAISVRRPGPVAAA